MIPDRKRLERLERNLGRLLVAGVALSAVALALGLALQLVEPGSTVSQDLLSAGFMILMATPMLRVIVSVVEYVLMREWFFMATTLVVVAELAAAVVYALHR
jgi:uncharacterized membrane protein